MNDKLFQILADTLGVDAASLSDTTSMDNTQQWDSVAHLNLMLSLEQACGMRFTPEELMQMRSVAAIREIFAVHGLS